MQTRSFAPPAHATDTKHETVGNTSHLSKSYRVWRHDNQTAAEGARLILVDTLLALPIHLMIAFAALNRHRIVTGVTVLCASWRSDVQQLGMRDKAARD